MRPARANAEPATALSAKIRGGFHIEKHVEKPASVSFASSMPSSLFLKRFLGNSRFARRNAK